MAMLLTEKFASPQATPSKIIIEIKIKVTMAFSVENVTATITQ